MRRMWLLHGIVFGWVVAVGGPLLALDRESRDQATATAEQSRRQADQERELLLLFADTLEQVRANYVDESITERELIEAAIRGMLSKLDPYSNYIPPKGLDVFKRSVERQYGGVGIRVQEQDGQIVIVSPLYGSPAHSAGVQAGDRLIKIDDVSTEGMSLDDAVKQMKGEIGSTVRLTVRRPETDETEVFALRRETVKLETVLGFRREEDGQWDYFCDPQHKVAYVRLTAFSKGTARQLTTVLRHLLAAEMQALIVDLRRNPGGLLTEAVQTADLFLRDGLITRTAVRNMPEQSWSAQAEGTMLPRGFPLVVLVNRVSASASEIVAACLQDHDLAVVVGERTWGKASVQNIIELENGKSALKLTTGSYQRPSGENIHRLPSDSNDDAWGVRPTEGHNLRMSRQELRALYEHFDRMDLLLAHPPTAEKDYVDRHLEDALACLRAQLAERAQADASGGDEQSEAAGDTAIADRQDGSVRGPAPTPAAAGKPPAGEEAQGK